ncbi:MAG: hypothetical protein BGO41_06860 [Clostridiales bacterium 38-18]|nr:MAG: hypothetical protein BGO41_06860 [Clostridiales bacterium 38-18]
MNKKVVLIGLVVLLAVAALFGYNQFFGPDAKAGEKSVTVEIYVESQGIDKTYNFDTDAVFLYDLLNEVKDQVKFESEDSSFGPMVVGFEGYKADSTSEYYHILINGEDAMVGVKDVPVTDGDVYRFELRNF